MTDEEVEKATVATGRWLYAGEAPSLVRILGLSYDYWFALGEAEGQLQEGEEPEALGTEGLLYYPFFTQIDGPGFPTVIQAKGYAQSKVQSAINWD
jgi:hypothetical protein